MLLESLPNKVQVQILEYLQNDQFTKAKALKDQWEEQQRCSTQHTLTHEPLSQQ